MTSSTSSALQPSVAGNETRISEHLPMALPWYTVTSSPTSESSPRWRKLAARVAAAIPVAGSSGYLRERNRTFRGHWMHRIADFCGCVCQNNAALKQKLSRMKKEFLFTLTLRNVGTALPQSSAPYFSFHPLRLLCIHRLQASDISRAQCCQDCRITAATQ